MNKQAYSSTKTGEHKKNIGINFFDNNKTQIIVVSITLFPTIILIISIFLLLFSYQNVCLQLVDDFSKNLLMDQINNSRILNTAIVFQLSSETQKFSWYINLLNEFFGNFIEGKVISNKKHIPALHNTDRTSTNNESQDLMNLFRKNQIFTSTWHLVNQSYLGELDSIQIEQISQSIHIDSIWKSIQFASKQRKGRYMTFKDLFLVFDYDGLIYSKSVNTSFASYKTPKGCPYQGQFNLDARCRFYYNATVQNPTTVIYQPQLFYSNQIPFYAQTFCQRKLKYQQQNYQNHSILCITQDLSKIPDYFSNFGSSSKFQFLLNPQYLTMIYNSENQQGNNETVTIEQIETKYLQDQREASKFIKHIAQDNQQILNGTNSLDFIGFNYKNQEEVFEYKRNQTSCIVIKNVITIIDKVPRKNQNQQLHKYQIKRAFIFLNAVSKEQKLEYSNILQSKIKYQNFLFMLISFIFTICILFVQILYSFQLGKQTIKPIIHLTNVLKQIATNNEEIISSDLQIGQMFSAEEINGKVKRTNNFLFDDYFQMEQDDLCYSSDTQHLFNSFKNLFKILSFATQNIYKENESISLINLSIEIQHFNQFNNYRALGVCYNNIGVIHYNCGRFYESIENFQRSIIYAKYELGFYQNVDNLTQNYNQSGNLNNKFNKYQFHLSYQQDSEDSWLGDRSKAQRESQSSKKQISQDKLVLFWSLYNRTINLIKALFSHINENNQIHLAEMLEEIILEIESMSQNYLPPCQKREMIECFMRSKAYKLQNKQIQSFQAQEQFKSLYIRHCQYKLNKNKPIQSSYSIGKFNQNYFFNQSEFPSQFSYQNNLHTLLASPIKKKRQIKNNDLFKKYKLYQKDYSENAQKSKIETKQKSNTLSLFYSQSLKKTTTNLVQEQFKNLSQVLKQNSIKENKSPQNYEPYFKVRKNQSQDKLCKYQFSSDIIYQYYALEQANFQIMLKNYQNAGLIITNIFEKCFYYLPFLKIKALKIAENIFKLSKVKNPILMDILNKYTNLAHANIKICTVSACMRKFSQFKSDAIQSDLINDILYKEKDLFGLINYDFKENFYIQQIQMVNAKVISKNYTNFQKMSLKNDYQKQQQKSNNNNNNFNLEKSSFKQNRNQSCKNLIQSNIQDNYLESFTFRQQQNIYSQQNIINRIVEEQESSQIQKIVLKRKVSDHLVKYTNEETLYSQSIELRQENEKSIFLNETKNYENSPNNFMKKYIFTPKISSFLKSPKQDSSQLIKIYDQEPQNEKKSTIYESFSDAFNISYSPIASQQALNCIDYTLKNSPQSILNKSILKEFRDRKISNSQQDNNQPKLNKFQMNSEILDKQKNFKNEKQQSDLNSFQKIKQNKCESLDEGKQNIQKNVVYFNVFNDKQPDEQEQQCDISYEFTTEEQRLDTTQFIQKEQSQFIEIFPKQNAFSSELIFHQGVQAALKQFILNTEEKIQIYLAQKKNKEEKIQQMNQTKQYHTYLLFITDLKLNIQNKFLFNELSTLLVNLNLELLILVLNQSEQTEEFNSFNNVLINQKQVITFFSSEDKLLQYIYSQREHLKNYLLPMIFEHF